MADHLRNSALLPVACCIPAFEMAKLPHWSLMSFGKLESSSRAHAGRAEHCSRMSCLQWCREHLGLHPCDRRSSLTYLKQNYPAVDFSLVTLSSSMSVTALPAWYRGPFAFCMLSRPAV